MKDALGKMKNSKEKHMCWQDGRLFEDKEDWVVDSCTTCTCQVGDIQTTLNGETWETQNVLGGYGYSQNNRFGWLVDLFTDPK